MSCTEPSGRSPMNRRLSQAATLKSFTSVMTERGSRCTPQCTYPHTSYYTRVVTGEFPGCRLFSRCFRLFCAPNGARTALGSALFRRNCPDLCARAPHFVAPNRQFCTQNGPGPPEMGDRPGFRRSTAGVESSFQKRKGRHPPARLPKRPPRWLPKCRLEAS